MKWNSILFFFLCSDSMRVLSKKIIPSTKHLLSLHRYTNRYASQLQILSFLEKNTNRKQILPLITKTNNKHMTEDIQETEKEVPRKNKIKHIVISGGGAMGLSFYGALKESNKQGIWIQEDIETIYATSIGTVIAVSISLGYSWEILDDFYIKRPWQQLFKFDLPSMMNSVQNQGLFSPTIVRDLFASLLNGKNISLDITLLDFYQLTKKDFHFITTEYHSFSVEDISYKTHPEWKLLDAIYASCCLPFVFAPLYKDNKIYLDGGIKMHYPLNLSIAAGNDPKEIMGIRRISSTNTDELALTRENSLFEVLYNIILKLIDNEKEPIYSDELGYNIEVKKDFYNIYTYLYKCIHSDEARKELIEVGVQSIYP